MDSMPPVREINVHNLAAFLVFFGPQLRVAGKNSNFPHIVYRLAKAVILWQACELDQPGTACTRQTFRIGVLENDGHVPPHGAGLDPTPYRLDIIRLGREYHDTEWAFDCPDCQGSGSAPLDELPDGTQHDFLQPIKDNPDPCRLCRGRGWI